MKRRHHNLEQVIGKYRWLDQYGRMKADSAKRVKEDRRLKKGQRSLRAKSCV